MSSLVSLFSLFRGPSTTDRLVRAARNEPLSDVLPAVLSAARQASLKELGDWVSLEVGGYYSSNRVATSETEKPEYREVAGRHIDRHKREINIQGREIQDMLNYVRLPQPVGTLEDLAESENGHLIDNPRGDLVQKYFGVTPAGFYITPSSIRTVLGSLQHQLIERLEQHRDEIDDVDLHYERVPGEGVPTLLKDHAIGLVVSLIVTVLGGLTVMYLGGLLGL